MGPSIYDKATGRGSLKLKGSATTVKKKRKHKTDDKHHDNDTPSSSSSSDLPCSSIPQDIVDESSSSPSSAPPTTTCSSSSCLLAESLLDNLSTHTPAERSFRLAQQKREWKRVDGRLKLTHRERMERLNAHLASLSEHFDIPKVGPG
eukprot:GHVS01088090.1.p1 GENE.GHVS01088090.1~~GHVS01088090.1.p1  ORF type:complete len:148 (+),score=46.35 GHVS01088090.1:185-628(+)